MGFIYPFSEKPSCEKCIIEDCIIIISLNCAVDGLAHYFGAISA